MARTARRPVRDVRRRRMDLVREDLFLTVAGFKAVREATTLRIAPLTLISGANSSGKSSFIQPYLLLKQTLESAFDPGPLLLYGPNAKFTEHTQTLSRGKARWDVADCFSIGMRAGEQSRTVTFAPESQELAIVSDTMTSGERTLELSTRLKQRQEHVLRAEFSSMANTLMRAFKEADDAGQGTNATWQVSIRRNRCFLEPGIRVMTGDIDTTINNFPSSEEFSSAAWVSVLRSIIHVPGLRGNPERSYPRSAVGSTYPGTFEEYVASIVHNWAERDQQTLARLASDLEHLGLTWKIHARKVNDATVELLVGRMPHAQQGGAHDLVSVADVGFGVSQTLPVVVALQVAEPGQIVYIEQPEIHLHPRAQLALADCLVDAANRGVKVIAETHSSLMIRAIQTAVAKGTIAPNSVSLNWFRRNPVTGVSEVDEAELDDAGSFGEWPLDFDEIAQDADWAYLEAARERS